MSAHANDGKTPRLRNSLAALAVFAAWAGLSGLALLSACSSPPSGFYTLVGGVPPSHTRSAAPPMLMIDVATVDVPAQVARTAFVVQADANRVNVLEQTRWASLPADEIRLALSQQRLAFSAPRGCADISRPRERAAFRIVAGLARADRRGVERARIVRGCGADLPQLVVTQDLALDVRLDDALALHLGDRPPQ